MEFTVDVSLDMSGLGRIERACKDLGRVVEVGILNDPAEAEIGALQHYGGTGVYSYGKYEGQEVEIPPRPFLAEAIEHNGRELLNKAAKKIDDFRNVDAVLNELGDSAKIAVQNKIDEYAAAGGNSPRTIETKGKDSPLIDKGNLRASIEYEVVE